MDVVVFRWANQVSDKLDESRMLVTEKVFGFLIAAIAVQLILDGLALAGVIAPVKCRSHAGLSSVRRARTACGSGSGHATTAQRFLSLWS